MAGGKPPPVPSCAAANAAAAGTAGVPVTRSRSATTRSPVNHACRGWVPVRLAFPTGLAVTQRSQRSIPRGCPNTCSCARAHGPPPYLALRRVCAGQVQRAVAAVIVCVFEREGQPRLAQHVALEHVGRLPGHHLCHRAQLDLAHRPRRRPPLEDGVRVGQAEEVHLGLALPPVLEQQRALRGGATRGAGGGGQQRRSAGLPATAGWPCTSSRYRNAPPPPRSPLRRTLRSSVSTSSRGRLHSPAALGGSSSSSLTYWPACGGGGRCERRGRAAECSRFKGRGAARPHQVALAAAGGQHGLSYASAGPQGRWVGGAARLGQLGAARAISRWPGPPGVLLTLEECLPPPSIRAPLASERSRGGYFGSALGRSRAPHPAYQPPPRPTSPPM